MVEDKRNWTARTVLQSEFGAGAKFLEDVVTALRNYGWSDHDVFHVRLAAEEALANAIRHGNQLDPNKRVAVECHVSVQRVRLEIHDEGNGFDPRGLPDCTADENLYRPSGRGVMLMRRLMTHVEFNPAGNRVVMEKLRGECDPR